MKACIVNYLTKFPLCVQVYVHLLLFVFYRTPSSPSTIQKWSIETTGILAKTKAYTKAKKRYYLCKLWNEFRILNLTHLLLSQLTLYKMLSFKTFESKWHSIFIICITYFLPWKMRDREAIKLKSDLSTNLAYRQWLWHNCT